jgi:hypothetical protein
VKRVAGWGIVLAMGAGSLLMWIVNPVAWLWLASQLSGSSQPSLGPYMLVLFGVVITMVAVGKSLGALNRLHARVTGGTGRMRVQAPWLRSMRGEREPATEHSVLDVVMVVSVGLAVLAAAVWFFLFAGSSLPGA